MKKMSRRMKRMSRGKKKVPGMNLVSLMDVFTILVFFLLVNSSSSEELQNPKNLELPDSVSELKPDETVVILITPTDILVKGEKVVNVADVIDTEGLVIDAVQSVLEQELAKAFGINASRAAATRRKVTIMGDKGIPFRLLKRVMASCTAAGYDKISLAVVQKASQS